MSLFINFVTAVAWIWGALMVSGLLLMLLLWVLGHPQKNASKEAAEFIRRGLLAWAWLFARYCL